MFKAQTLRRSFSLLRRNHRSTVARSAARDGHDSYQIQRVYFKKKPHWSRSRTFGRFLAVAGSLLLWKALYEAALVITGEGQQQGQRVSRPQGLPRPPSNKDRQQDTGASEETDEEEDEDEEVAEDDEDEDEEKGLLFFPTGLSRPKPRELYKGSDPEWQEFIKLSKDPERITRIKNQVAYEVRKSVGRVHWHGRRLGKINPDSGGFYLELIFPPGPPIEFERPGYELTEDLTFRKTTQPVHPRNHHRLHSALLPTAVANSFLADIKARVRAGYRAVKKIYMGWAKPSDGPSMNLVVRNIDSQTPSSTNGTSTPKPDSSASTTAISGSSRAPSGNVPSDRINITLPDPTTIPQLSIAQFRSMLQRKTKIPPANPRGYVVITGLVQVMGSTGHGTADVYAIYEPHTAKFHRIEIRVKHTISHIQRPRG